MMAFNPAAAFNTPQLLAAPQPTTPVRTEPSGSVTSTSHNDLNDAAVRFLTPSGPLMTGMMPVFSPDAAFRAMAQGLPFPSFYPGLPPAAEMKPEMMFMDPSFAYHPYDGARRKNATRETTAPLKSWLNEHRKNPYPTKAEKIMLALLTKMTLTQVSTWFANARRRLKKENKMTWSPRNRPGEDDDDDLADAEPSDRDPSDRPSSSASNVSELNGSVKPENLSSESNNNEEKRAESAQSSEPATESPRKSKIWSIAETLSTRAAVAASAKKEEETASTSAEKSEDGDSENARVSSASANALSPNGISAQPPYMQFWPQMAMAMARMPFQRQDLFSMMAQSGQVRPPLIFNPLLMPGLGTPPIPTSVTPTTQSNGTSAWSDRQSTSPTSSTHSASGGNCSGTTEHDKSS